MQVCSLCQWRNISQSLAQKMWKPKNKRKEERKKEKRGTIRDLGSGTYRCLRLEGRGMFVFIFVGLV